MVPLYYNCFLVSSFDVGKGISLSLYQSDYGSVHWVHMIFLLTYIAVVHFCVSFSSNCFDPSMDADFSPEGGGGNCQKNVIANISS